MLRLAALIAAIGLSSSMVTAIPLAIVVVAVPSDTFTGMLNERTSSTGVLLWSIGRTRSTVQLPVLLIAATMTVPAVVLPRTVLPSGLTCQVIGRPPDVRPGVVGTPKVTLNVALSVSVIVICPATLMSFVVSVGVPVESAIPPARPSSETTATLPTTTGASFAPKMLIFSVEPFDAVPSDAV